MSRSLFRNEFHLEQVTVLESKFHIHIEYSLNFANYDALRNILPSKSNIIPLNL